MSKRFIIEIANKNAEAALRRILRDNYMEGRIKLSFQREPDFFKGLDIEGNFVQVGLGRDLEKNKVIGFAMRTIKELYVNGEKKNIGYLSNLRLDEEYRGGTLIWRAYRFFKDLHRDGRAKIYLTSILEDNRLALEILTSGRGGLPPYRDYGRYISYTVGLKKRRKNNSSDIEIRKGNKDMLEDIITFLNTEGRKRQFYPVYKAEDFLNTEGILRGLNIENLFVALKGNEIVGTIGLWDQTSFKQDVIYGYSPLIKLIKPFWNIFAPLRDFPSLPPSGTALNFFFASLILVKNNYEPVFQALIEELRKEGSKRGFESMVLGLHSKDSLNSVMNQYPSFKLKSRIFLVHWKDGEQFYNSIDKRTPYLEVATL